MLHIVRRFQVWIAYSPFHTVCANHCVARHGYTGNYVLHPISVAQLHAVIDLICQRCLWVKSPEIISVPVLGVMDITCTRT